MRYTEILSQSDTLKLLHDLTEKYIQKLFMIPKCYLCIYSNNSSINDWYNQYYTRVRRSKYLSPSYKKRRVIKVDNYLGEQEMFLFIPIRHYRTNENYGGLLLPLGKNSPHPNQFDFILVRIVLSAFLNQWHLLIVLQDQAGTQ